jgi:hypothetical protein
LAVKLLGVAMKKTLLAACALALLLGSLCRPAPAATLDADDLAAITAILSSYGVAKESTVLGQFGVTWGTTYPLVNRDGIINVPRGDVQTISTTLGASFPLAGRTVYFTAQKTKAATNTTAIVNRAMTITDEAARTCTITLTAAETATAGQYHYEIEARDTTTEANPSTAEAGTLNIIEDLRK